MDIEDVLKKGAPIFILLITISILYAITDISLLIHNKIGPDNSKPASQLMLGYIHFQPVLFASLIVIVSTVAYVIYQKLK